MAPSSPPTDRKSRWPFRIGIVLLVAAAIWIASTIAGGSLLPVGTAAPAWKLPRGDGAGGTLSSGELEGKVVVLDFWSTTCPPCMRQMKDLEAVHRRMKDRGVVVVGVACGGESVERIEQFAKDRGVGYSLVVDEGEATLAYQVLSLPSLYVVGRDGKIASAHRGYTDAVDLAKAVNRALEQR